MMKKFLLRISVFLLTLIGAISIALYSSLVINRVKIGNCVIDDNINTIIVGDSHTMWSIDDSNLENVKNLSFNAEGYLYTYHKLKYILENEPQINRVYLGFSYHNLSDYYNDYIYGDQARGYFHRYLSVIPFQDLIKILYTNSSNAGDVIQRTVKNGLSYALNNNCAMINDAQFMVRERTLNNESMLKRIKQQYYEDGKIRDISQSNKKYLDLILTLIKSRELELVILDTPLHESYQQRIPVSYIELYDELISDHKLTVYNFEDLMLEDSDFLPDADHVNYSGAMKATQAFKNYHDNN